MIRMITKMKRFFVCFFTDTEQKQQEQQQLSKRNEKIKRNQNAN